MQLAALEGEAGARLLRRTARGVTPTGEGRRLLAAAAELFRAHDRLREAWAAGDDGGDLRIAASDTVARHLLPAALRALARRLPHARLHLVQSATPETLNRLRAGEVDVGFVLRPVADPLLAQETVLRYRHVAIFPRRSRARGPVEPAALARGPLVLLARGTQTRHLVDEAFRARGLAPDHVLEVGTVSLQKELVRCGLGAGIVPGYAVEPRDRLLTRPIAGASVREVAVAWRGDLPLTRAAGAFLEEVRQVARAAGRSAVDDPVEGATRAGRPPRRPRGYLGRTAEEDGAMATIMDQESLRKALRWLADRRREEPSAPRLRLVDEAARRFDLDPLEADFLQRNWKEDGGPPA
jgi:DNA-binding transcriptional LysR family regulator